jgi:[protein-PII] uridylyltransferase
MGARERERVVRIVAEYLKAREVLVRDSKPGVSSAHRLAELTDKAVSASAEAALSGATTIWALIALGGYGASRLLPSSDIDILLVVGANDPALQCAAEDLLYPIWDAGLSVGHALRTPREHLSATREDVDTLTASLTGRPLAGDAALAEKVLDRCARDAHRRRARIIPELAARTRPGSPFDLEPDLKAGAGGQRDLDELSWTASVLLGRARALPEDLRELGLLTAEDVRQVYAAQEGLTEARWIAHTVGRGGNTLTAETIAEHPALGDSIHATLADVAFMLTAIRHRLGDLATLPKVAVAEDLVSLIQEGADPAVLEALAWSGKLDTLLPGFRELMTVRRPGIGHRFTVGAHMLRTASAIHEVANEDRRASDTLGSMVDTWPLLVAALTHDAGKTEPGPGHAERSAPFAHQVALTWGLPAASAETAATLAREHLTLVEVALREDPDDDDALLRTAARLGDTAVVRSLYLLSAADSRATGPGMWTEWHSALLGEWVDRLESALTTGPRDLVARAEDVRRQVLAAVSGESHDLIASAPVRYLAARTPVEVAADAGASVAVLGSGDPAHAELRVSVGPADRSFAVTIVTRARESLLAIEAGSITLAGLDILGLEAHSLSPRLAVHSFVVRSATDAPTSTATWNSLDRTLRAALEGRLDLGVRIAERRRHYPPASSGPSAVSVDALPGGSARLNVRTPDRTGLLYSITSTISESGFDVIRATALTRAGEATDAFHIIDPTVASAHIHGRLGHLAMLLRGRLAD